MTDQRLHDLLHETVSDVTVPDLTDAAWRSGTRARRVVRRRSRPGRPRSWSGSPGRSRSFTGAVGRRTDDRSADGHESHLRPFARREGLRR